MADSFQLIGLCCGWLLWCGLHSWLIWPSVQNCFKRWLGQAYRGYRLGYNLLAGLTIVPLLLWEQRFDQEVLFAWDGPYLVVRCLLIGAGGLLLVAGALNYPMKSFFGWSQLATQSTQEPPPLQINGISRYVRHPWYLAGFLLLWSRVFTPASLLSSTLLSLYLLIGAVLEEHKLILTYGETYRKYQQKVPMFLPGFRRKGTD